jgi:hypothetical protein
LIALSLITLLAAPLRAETGGAVTVQSPPRPSHYWRKYGVGLLIGSGVCLALGATFVGLASKANDDIIADMQYHPSRADDRDRDQIAGSTLLLVGGASLVSGLVLLW